MSEENEIVEKSVGAGASVKAGQLCKVCEDKAAGKYYGVLVCDGCKGFFRRSVRNNQVYYCRFDRTCVVGKDNRNQCRYCRLRKCFRLGMKKDAVQSERDRTRARMLNGDEKSTDNNVSTLTMGRLIQADQLTKQSANLTGEKDVTDADVVPRKIATADEFYDSTKEQLLVLVQWAKHIPAFCDLRVEDKVSLLRGHAGDNLVLSMVRRSLHLDNMLLLGNGCVIPMETEDVICVNRRIMTELVKPLRKINMDDTEFACLKAVLFFDPHAPGLLEPDRIHELRNQAQLLLEDYIVQRQLDPRGRFGEMLLTLPPLRSIMGGILEEMQFRKFFGMAKVDKLLRETLLRDDVDAPKIAPPEEVPTVSSTTLCSNVTSPCSMSDEDSESKHHFDTQSPPVVHSNYCDEMLVPDPEYTTLFNAEGYA